MPSVLQTRRGMVSPSAHQGTFYVVATNSPYGQICQAYVRQLPAKVRNHVRVSTFGAWQEVAGRIVGSGQPGRTLLVSRLADIPEDAHTLGSGSKERRHLVFVEDMPIEAISSRVPRLNVRDARRLHLARERNPDAISAMIRRTITGIAVSQGRHAIIDAWIEGVDLVVLSPSFNRLRVPVAAMVRYLGNEPERIKAFEVDEDGSFLYWRHADVHLGWEQLHGIVDPTALICAQQRSKAFNIAYGAAIRGVREAHGLRQSDIRGLAERHLRRIEHGQIAATSSALTTLALAHGMSLANYLAELAERV
jgi:nitrite reductase/ring-hydroxylating ferredoxin subunit